MSDTKQEVSHDKIGLVVMLSTLVADILLRIVDGDVWSCAHGVLASIAFTGFMYWFLFGYWGSHE